MAPKTLNQLLAENLTREMERQKLGDNALGALAKVSPRTIANYNEHIARQSRDLCLKIAAHYDRAVCETNYQDALRRGKAEAAAAKDAPSWNKAGSKERLRQEIEECRHQQARYQNAPQVVERCERLDYEFRQKFNVAP